MSEEDQVEYTDRAEQVRLQSDEKKILAGFIILGIIVCILAIDVIYLQFLKTETVQPSSATVVYNTSTQSSPPPVSQSQSKPTPNSAVTTATVTPTITPSSTPSMTPVPQAQSAPVANSSSSTVKDYFVPLGTGSTQSNSWVDISGAQVSLDFGQYQNIKQIVLEVTVNVPTANEDVSVRLYNETDKHPVWNSTVTMPSGNMTQFLVSPAIIYDTGVKVYNVQMMTQLQSPAYLNLARVHITLS